MVCDSHMLLYEKTVTWNCKKTQEKGVQSQGQANQDGTVCAALHGPEPQRETLGPVKEYKFLGLKKLNAFLVARNIPKIKEFPPNF